MTTVPTTPDASGGSQKYHSAKVAAIREWAKTNPPVPVLLDLTKGEAAKLAAHEKVIAAGLAAFMEVGNALAAVREGKLYRATHATFSDYCADRWGISDRQGRRLVAAAEVAELTGPTGPVSGRVTRELTSLRDDPAALAAVWSEAQHLAGGGTVTAAHVVAARENAVVRTVAHRRPKVVAQAIDEAPAALAAVVASPAVRKAIDASDEGVTESVKRHAKEKRERPDSPGIVRIELLVIADQAHALSRKIIDLMRAGAMEGVPDDVRQEVADTHRKIADTHRWAAELCESGVRATDEALDEWLDDQPGEHQ